MTLLRHEGHACKLTRPICVLHKRGVAPPAKCPIEGKPKVDSVYFSEIVNIAVKCTINKFSLQEE